MFLNQLSILNGVNVSISKGETVGIIGPNGSGKTTFFNCLSGFNIPQKGSIFLNEQDITRLPPYKRSALGIGRVFQNSGVFREMTVLENVITALEGRQSSLSTFFPWSKINGENARNSLNYLDEIGLAAKAQAKASSLSGGQMRLLEIIRTLAFGADMFLLDEPTAGVSPKMKDDVASAISRLQDLGKTVLIIEHDINFIQKFCDRIVVLDVGRVVMDDTPAKVREDPMLQEIYFGGNQGNGKQQTAASRL
ncbi:MAG: hypothetical protein DCC75_14240 [Proteobacteria bacterium]|nr:MAG: hypothetical protein DCC75_14240 [Pseudomonadota bacterium]